MSTRTGMIWTAAASITLIAMTATTAAKTPGSTYCFISTCHRVLTLAETRAAVGKPRAMHASHYDDPSRDRFNPSLITSSGELFRPDAPNNAASPIYPDGTLVAVYAPTTKRGAIVRINNAGPYWGNRLIDLSRGLADKLGIAKSGVGRVVVEVLAAPTKKEATYARGRRYAPVPGFLGKVASIESVRDTWQIRQGIKTAPIMVAQPAPPAPVSDTAVSMAGLVSADDMRVVSGEVPPAAVATLVIALPANGKRPAPPRQLTQPSAPPRQVLAKKQVVQFR
jgi:rare lipoprotein A